MTVRKAVIPAAGLGTRFLPATKAQPKEMIPVVDKPMIQYVVEEAVRAGIDDILIVTSRGKGMIDDHFDKSLELEHHLETSDKSAELEQIRRIADLADIFYVRQKEPLGLGHAVSVARSHIGDAPFVVMLGDEMVPRPRGDEPALIESMMAIYERHQANVVTVVRVAKEDIPSYGVIDPEKTSDGLLRVLNMVEKPPAEEARSDLGSLWALPVHTRYLRRVGSNNQWLRGGDPAHRCDQPAGAGAIGLRLRSRGPDVRRGQEARLPQGDDRAWPPAQGSR